MELNKKILLIGMICLVLTLQFIYAEKNVYVSSNYNNNPIYNLSEVNGTSANFEQNVSASWFNGLFNWKIGTLDKYILSSFNGASIDLSLNETVLNNTIDNKIVVFNGTIVHTTDTNASSCANGEYLDGTGICINFNTTVQDLSLNSTDEPNLNVNSSLWWDNETLQSDLNVNNSNTTNNWITNDGIVNGINTTQMENSNQQLNIKESWFTTLWNTIFNTKTTDDLSQGTTNFYDNRSANETRWNTLYADISVVSNPFDQTLNTTSNVTFANMNISTDGYLNIIYDEYNVFGEPGAIRLKGVQPQSKPSIEFYSYDPASDQIRGVGWIVCHYNLSSGNRHQHCSWETLDNVTGTPSINTKFEITYGSNLSGSDSNLFAQFSSLDHVNFGSGVDIWQADGNFLHSGNFDVFPNNQGTIALRLKTDGSQLQYQALGTAVVEFLDNVNISGSNDLWVGGDVGIGTQNPTHKLNVAGSANVTGNITTSFYFGDGSQLTNIPGDNSSFNQSLTDTLYANIQWDYNQTIPANTYTDTVSQNLQTNITDLNSSVTGRLANKIDTSDESTLNVNSSDFWDDTNTFNNSQMENNQGILNILESFFIGLIQGDYQNSFNNNFSAKTTDNLTQGSTNFYDNRSANEARWNTLYLGINSKADDSELLDGRDSSAYFPFNTSVSGSFDFNGGWDDGGMSFVGGDIYAQTVYVYTIAGLNVTTLNTNGSILPSIDNTFDLGSPEKRWEDLFLSGEVRSNGTGDNWFLGAVGIGTLTPEGNLHVVRTGVSQGTPSIGVQTVAVFQRNNLNNHDADISIIAEDSGFSNINFGDEDDEDAGRMEYHHATNSFHFMTNDIADRLVIDSSGNVGIGTTAPKAGLHGSVNLGMFLFADVEADNAAKTGRWGIQHYDVDEQPFIGIVYSAQTSENNLFIGGGTGAGNAATSIKFLTAANSVTTTGSIRMTIDNNGNVGIGTTTPTQKLDVSGSVNISGVYYGDGSGLTNLTSELVADSVNTTHILDGTITDADINDSTNLTLGQKIIFALGGFIQNIVSGWIDVNGSLNVSGGLNVDSGTLFVNETNNNVGIGLTDPSSKLDVNGTIKGGMGASASRSAVIMKANVITTAVGTDADTNQKDLMTYTLPANSFSSDGNGVKITAWGTFAANANSKRVGFFFGAATLGTHVSTYNNKRWKFEVLVFRTGSDTQDIFEDWMVSNFVDKDMRVGTSSIDDGAAIVIKVTGENGVAAANEIVAEGMLVEFMN